MTKSYPEMWPLRSVEQRGQRPPGYREALHARYPDVVLSHLPALYDELRLRLFRHTTAQLLDGFIQDQLYLPGRHQPELPAANDPVTPERIRELADEFLTSHPCPDIYRHLDRDFLTEWRSIAGPKMIHAMPERQQIRADTGQNPWSWENIEGAMYHDVLGKRYYDIRHQILYFIDDTLFELNREQPDDEAMRQHQLQRAKSRFDARRYLDDKESQERQQQEDKIKHLLGK